jgi:hypothetical protein
VTPSASIKSDTCDADRRRGPTPKHNQSIAAASQDRSVTPGNLIIRAYTQLDLIFGEFARPDDKKVGHSSQYFCAPRDILTGQSALKLIDLLICRSMPIAQCSVGKLLEFLSYC